MTGRAQRGPHSFAIFALNAEASCRAVRIRYPAPQTLGKGKSTMRRIMYVENKCGGLDGDGRIGWVELSRSGRSFFYRGHRLLKTKSGYKYNCIDEETGDEYWVSGPRKDGSDKLYGGLVQIDDDARVEYWTTIRRRPALVHITEYRAGVSTRTKGHTRGDDLSVHARSRAGR